MIPGTADVSRRAARGHREYERAARARISGVCVCGLLLSERTVRVCDMMGVTKVEVTQQ